MHHDPLLKYPPPQVHVPGTTDPWMTGLWSACGEGPRLGA
jgi:hypothetical protein